ncbi:hypothetical protein A11S_2081 [Micavibrio aeruginosavorus EPB]|uniref:Uncharacterized protein n=1 Tax=Micavibrio aeruginosavorus EPB TaxID=349215 RepID=M4VK53_9BACT|nr:hypothetical protein A11S_2081 [Micavibrio aeruginosavorus EPB]
MELPQDPNGFVTRHSILPASGRFFKFALLCISVIYLISLQTTCQQEIVQKLLTTHQIRFCGAGRKNRNRQECWARA